jgi:hypothetical protein
MTGIKFKRNVRFLCKKNQFKRGMEGYSGQFSVSYKIDENYVP